MAQCPIVSHQSSLEQDTLKVLTDDIKQPEFIDRLDEINLWMNIIPTVSSYHYDSYHGFLCLISGSKKLRLISPGKFIHSESLFKECYNHPLKHLDYFTYEIELKRGDMLYIPEGWWYYEESNSNTTVISIWWYEIDQKVMVQGNL